MSYNKVTDDLYAVFKSHGFEQLLSTKQQKAHQVHRCASGAELTVHFPGYKAQLNPFRPDYRVDITKPGQASIPLSHANLIVDIYNKVVNGNMNPDDLQQALLEQLCDCGIDYEALATRLPYRPTSPSEALLNYAQLAHDGKSYKREGNSADLTIEELFSSIKWISIQEDFNYPMPRYQGRKMPYTRYLEAIHVAKHQNSQHTLAEVIQRALSHGRPFPWQEMNALELANSAMTNYSLRSNI
ncbi:hypothetical protein MUN82_03760 [Hymenobacter aerilatus]|uniref:Uncharacterized protein n=1 Tax=Hymenobacter aerilatus TaxID=2932251 RepID=A0A8T9SZ58_9BACT|nr:hypothetical protein [Hymenobacter aerilatus]UOR06214.1 hypothetical protein MUN82_03760 [Hymenobacter aerilatus]